MNRALGQTEAVAHKGMNTHRVVRESLQDDGLEEGIAGGKGENVALRLNSAGASPTHQAVRV